MTDRRTPDRTFKLHGLDRLDSHVRSFILICVALAYPAWDAGFDLAVHGRVFYDKILFVWTVASALLLAFLVHRQTRRRLPAMAWLAIGFPTVWIVLALIVHAAPEALDLRYLLFWSGVVAYVVCLPYTVYLIVAVAYPDLLQAPKHVPKLVVAFFGLFALLGLFAGSHHPRILTCDDFEIAGEYVPHDCRPARENPTDRPLSR